MIRWGLCCTFWQEAIKFHNTTAAAVAKMKRPEALAKLAALCRANADSLWRAIEYCGGQGIGSFRIQSQILPLKTHPHLGYAVDELPDWEGIVKKFEDCRALSQKWHLRTCFHPDQFVVLNSPRPEVLEASLAELEYQAEVAEWVGADVINIHGGGAYGDKSTALARFARNLDRLSARAREKLTVENDDKVFTPQDLLPICASVGIPLVYDVHHHRCHPDDFSVEEGTARALATWSREPLFHISSPREGWGGPHPERHHDYIDREDFPDCWRSLELLTVEVEAKAKELAVLQLKAAVDGRGEELIRFTNSDEGARHGLVSIPSTPLRKKRSP